MIAGNWYVIATRGADIPTDARRAPLVTPVTQDSITINEDRYNLGTSAMPTLVLANGFVYGLPDMTFVPGGIYATSATGVGVSCPRWEGWDTTGGGMAAVNGCDAPTTPGIYTFTCKITQYGGDPTNSCSDSRNIGNLVVNAPVMSGTLTPATSSCVIANGASSCNVNLNWSIVNTVGIPTSIIASGMTNIDVANTLVTPQSGYQSVPVSWGGGTFYLYNNAVQLATTTIAPSSVACNADYNWNGSICVQKSTVPLVPANGKTYPSGTSSYGSDTQCATGTSSNTVFPAAGGSPAYWQCLGSNGGTSSGTITPHSASRDALVISVNFSASPMSSIFAGNSTNLIWSSNAPSCAHTISILVALLLIVLV